MVSWLSHHYNSQELETNDYDFDKINDSSRHLTVRYEQIINKC